MPNAPVLGRSARWFEKLVQLVSREHKRAALGLTMAPRTTLAPLSGWALANELPWRSKSAPWVVTRSYVRPAAPVTST